MHERPAPWPMVLRAASQLAFRERLAQLPLLVNVGFAHALSELLIVRSAQLFHLLWWTMPQQKTNCGCSMIPKSTLHTRHCVVIESWHCSISQEHRETKPRIAMSKCGEWPAPEFENLNIETKVEFENPENAMIRV